MQNDTKIKQTKEEFLNYVYQTWKGKNSMRGTYKLILRLAMIGIVCLLCSCQMEERDLQTPKDLVSNIEDYILLFEENNVQAEMVKEDEEEYLQITFPDETVAYYKDRLIDISKIIERQKYGKNYIVSLKIKIIDQNIATVTVKSECEDGETGGSVSGDYILPDFNEIVSHGWEPSINDLAIVKWIPREDLAAIYQQAKDMEEIIQQYTQEHYNK